MPKLTLYYFDTAGRAEAIRFILRYANIPFDDVRIKKEEWTSWKSKFPLGQVPVLEIDDGVMIPETLAILRYVGSLAGIRPPTSLYEEVIINVVESVLLTTFSNALAKVMRAPDAEKQQARATLMEEELPRIFAQLNSYLTRMTKNTEFLGSSLSYADVVLHLVVHMFVKEGVSETLPVIKDFDKKFPKLFQIYSNVMNVPKIQESHKK